MASSSSLPLSFPSSSLYENWEYDVFPSFHRPDVRKTFLSYVLKEFRRKGINLFIDNEIKKGESIGPELKLAIRGSKIAVVLLSTNYASSSWCLDELVDIMKKEPGQIVITIFYEVDPTDIRKQTGHFGKVFKKNCKGKDKEKVETWRKALEDVANIAGYHSRSSDWVDDASMIEKIAAYISDMLNHSAPSRDFANFIGLENHMERIKPLLRLDLDKVRMIGIWGPSGIGKTTIVRFLFDELSGHFQNSALMDDIKGSYPKLCFDEYKAKLQLQKDMLSKMFNQKDIMIRHLGVAQQRLRKKKVFLVLDDVDRLAQVDALAGSVQWFGEGSRIIITTEDLGILRAIGINCIYKVNFPSVDQAIQMFCMYAFHKKSPEYGFDKVAREITYLVGELPLGLKVMGSYFRGLPKDKKRWSVEVSRLRTKLDGEIASILKFSYDALCDEDKDLFRIIACFFNNEDISIVEIFLAGRFNDVRQRLYDLQEKSLISIQRSVYYDEYHENIRMHKLLARLGEEIAREESVREPGQYHFLNDYKNICQVLTGSKTITRSVFKGKFRVVYDSGHPIIVSWWRFPSTCLRFTKKLELCDETKLLQKLKRLDLSYSKKLKELPNVSNVANLECSSLVKLSSSIGNASNLEESNLEGCSLLVELSSSNLRKSTIEECLSVEELPYSNLRKSTIQKCSSLKGLLSSVLHAIKLLTLLIKSCSSLVGLPSSIGFATNLEELNLEVELPSSVGNATNLLSSNLEGCSGLVELPSSIGNATNLLSLNLEGCSGLVELPFSIGTATNLPSLNLKGCSSLVELPSSIGNAASQISHIVELSFSVGIFINLQRLNFEGCSGLVELPSSIGNATNLLSLNLEGCSGLVELPSSIGSATNLLSLNLEGCSGLVELPSSIGNATNLLNLNLEGCSGLVELPSSIGNATNLLSLNLEGCSSVVELPTSIGNATNLLSLNFKGCSSLVKLPSSIGNATNLHELNLKGCSSLISLPWLPESLSDLNAENCESLEKLYCSFYNPFIQLNFINCFNLNKQARELLIQTPTPEWVILPGKKVPACFTYRACGSHVTVKLNQKHLPTSRKFKACVLVVNKGENDLASPVELSCSITSKQKYASTARFSILLDIVTEHLHIFDLEVEGIPSTELDFTFELSQDPSYGRENLETWEIKECGIL